MAEAGWRGPVGAASYSSKDPRKRGVSAKWSMGQRPAALEVRAYPGALGWSFCRLPHYGGPSGSSRRVQIRHRGKRQPGQGETCRSVNRAKRTARRGRSTPPEAGQDQWPLGVSSTADTVRSRVAPPTCYVPGWAWSSRYCKEVWSFPYWITLPRCRPRRDTARRRRRSQGGEWCPTMVRLGCRAGQGHRRDRCRDGGLEVVRQ